MFVEREQERRTPLTSVVNGPRRRHGSGTMSRRDEGRKAWPLTKPRARYGLMTLIGAFAWLEKPSLFFMNTFAKLAKSGHRLCVASSESAAGGAEDDDDINAPWNPFRASVSSAAST